MSTYRLTTGSEVHFDKTKVLAPDLVTEELAVEGAGVLSLRVWSQPPSLLELGIGTGAFSRTVLDLARTSINICGIDVDPNAVEAAQHNLEHHARLAELMLLNCDWNAVSFAEDAFDLVYFNPPYLAHTATLREPFKLAPETAVYAEDPQESYLKMIPALVRSLRIGGVAIVRYPGDGSLTFAGEDATRDHSPWAAFDQIDRTIKRLAMRSEWLHSTLPQDVRSYMWRSRITDRRVNAEIFARIGDDIANAPRVIQDQEEYWGAMNMIYDQRQSKKLDEKA